VADASGHLTAQSAVSEIRLHDGALDGDTSAELGLGPVDVDLPDGGRLRHGVAVFRRTEAGRSHEPLARFEKAAAAHLLDEGDDVTSATAAVAVEQARGVVGVE